MSIVNNPLIITLNNDDIRITISVKISICLKIEYRLTSL